MSDFHSYFEVLERNTMIIYYTAVDNGDGSCSVQFFDCQEAILLLEEIEPEYYRDEGGGWFECEGFSSELLTMEYALERQEEYLELRKDY